MTKALEDFKVAAAFLTRVPISHGTVISMGGVSAWFPVVGILLGCVSSGVWILCNSILSPLSSSVLTIASLVIITGAFHYDGLADSMDGLVGGWTVQQRLDILKDSRHGTYGVMALVLQVALQISLLSELNATSGVVALLVSQSIGRASAVWIMGSGAGLNEGLGANYVKDVKVRHQIFATVFALLILFALMGISGTVVLIAVFVVTRLFASWAVKKIGGIVGDVLGATEQIGESVALVTIVGLVAKGVTIPWW